MRYKLALFDLDGTVLDTLEDLTDATNAAMAMHGYPTHSIDAVRSFVGNGIGNLIRSALPEGTNEAEFHTVLGDFKKYYGEHCADKTKPYDGVLEMLRTLRAAGVQTAVVSNKADFAVKALAERYFKGLFDIAIGEREGVARKPAPDSVLEVMRELGADAAECVYIGDSDVDVLTAKNAGVDGIFVTWGFRSEACLRETGATELVDAVPALTKQILK
jgi:phosphoglycolate phosphatase